MRRSELFFQLPESLIAQEALHPADQARLMLVDRKAKKTSDDIFLNLPGYLRKGDTLVFNNSKVLPARLLGNKKTGGKVETLLLKQLTSNSWEALVNKGASLMGQEIFFGKKLRAQVLRNSSESFVLTFNLRGPALLREILAQGHIPTPPYIKKIVPPKDYQNVFAKVLGSAAAPTAGLHFTKRLLQKLKRNGIQIEFVTLHVGLGTFQPVRSEQVEKHDIHEEYYELNTSTLKRLRQVKKEKRRIIAVGTTSCRVLETISPLISSAKKIPSAGKISGSTKIFIYPGYRFKTIDGLITNFHTPYSSLLALVMAFAGKSFAKRLYARAVQKKYRFFSLGDGMFIF